MLKNILNVPSLFGGADRPNTTAVINKTVVKEIKKPNFDRLSFVPTEVNADNGEAMEITKMKTPVQSPGANSTASITTVKPKSGSVPIYTDTASGVEPVAVKPKGLSGSALGAALFGGQGEAKIESTESDKKFCLGVFADAIYERRNTPVGSFVHVKHAIKTPYLSKEGEPSFELKLPKPPAGLLYGVAQFFRKIMKEMNNSEVMVQIYWNFEKEKYQIYVPEQRVAGASISFDHSEKLQNDPNMYWVFDIHSHNTMSAFFSGTDSADEKSTRIFGVLGQLDKEDFASTWRAGVNGKFVGLDKETIWDMENTRVWNIPDKVMKRVTERQYAYANNRYKPTDSKTNAAGKGAQWINKNPNVHRTVHQPYQHQSKNMKTGGGYGGYGGDYDQDYWRDYDYLNDPMGYYEYIEREESLSISAMDNDGITAELWGNDADPILIEECIEMQGDIEKIYAAANSGNLGTTELSAFVRQVILYFSDFDAFSKSTCLAILDEMSSTMRTEEFNEIMRIYSNQHVA